MSILSSESFPLFGNRLIEASAGTGKTHTITNLYLRLLLGRGAPAREVSEILVLTFTIAATEELRDRIRKRIITARRAFALGASDDEFLARLINESDDTHRDASLLSAALQLMDEAAIFTIHGFCARVLADNAFETGTLFDQNLDADRDALLETATEDCFRSYILTLAPLLRGAALDQWPTPAKLEEKLKPFLFRANLTMLPPYRNIDVNALEDRIREVKRRWIDDGFPDVIRAAGINGSTGSIKWLELMTEWCRSESLTTDMWPAWTSSLLEKRVNKKGYMPSHVVIDLIDAIQDDLTQIPFNLWHEVTGVVRANLEHYKADLSQLTLDDLLTKVRDALRGSSGDWLVELLAERWPVAMIDEFQDTDDIQYEIFTRIYSGREQNGLVLIGDPKQAIYQFRGADVFTYINARRAVSADDIFSLTTNWRSTAPFIEAVNILFDQPNIFDNDADIPFHRAVPAPSAAGRSIRDDACVPAPITIYQVEGDKLNANNARRLAMAWAAEETVRLLRGASKGDILIDGEPLKAGHIAFLVRGKTDARAARYALAERGIRSVYVTLESVFLTDTAEDLKAILQAALEPTNERALRAALAVRLMKCTATEIDRLSHDVIAQQAALEEFSEYHEIWATRDVATMIEKVVENRDIARKWFGETDGERQVTNLRHLTELLQRRAAAAPGMHRLLKWFTREKLEAETVDTEERQLRLESDRDLVKIVTMHASKGLEYEVVMIPMAAFTPPPSSRAAPYMFHASDNQHFNACIDFSDDDSSKQRARQEQVAEELRLLYVAITRAKHKCYIGFTQDAIKDTALGRLLQLPAFDAMPFEDALRARLPERLFDLLSVTRVDRTLWSPVRDTADWRRPHSAPDTRSYWRVHSYTGVARRIVVEEQASLPTPGGFTPGFGDDELESEPASTTRFNRFTFPKGPRAGVALHTLLENIDFDRPVADQAGQVSGCLARIGVTQNLELWNDVLKSWMTDVLSTSLSNGIRLADVPRRKRLDEMEFHFPLSTSAGLLDLLKSHGYLDPSATLDIGVLQGMMTGLIDLVFEKNGQYFLVDYKSNFLGTTPDDYSHAHLTEAMRHHRYDLQYLIYCVALRRYLESRVPGFDYDAHFGGVYYLFLRGMNGTADGSGVYFGKPDVAFLDQLDAMLGGTKA